MTGRSDGTVCRSDASGCRSGRRRERGATLVEASIALFLLIVVTMGIAELGLAFKDWLTVSHGAREGARAGATYADNPHADIEILRAVDGDLAVANANALNYVRVFNPSTGVGTTYTRAAGTCGWSPCPDPDDPGYITPTWPPSSRDVTAPVTDRLGVEVGYTHTWLTGLFRSTSNFTVHVVYQIEPQLFQ